MNKTHCKNKTKLAHNFMILKCLSVFYVKVATHKSSGRNGKTQNHKKDSSLAGFNFPSWAIVPFLMEKEAERKWAYVCIHFQSLIISSLLLLSLAFAPNTKVQCCIFQYEKTGQESEQCCSVSFYSYFRTNPFTFLIWRLTFHLDFLYLQISDWDALTHNVLIIF